VKNGTNAAVLVSELLAGDGPAADLAEDFVALRCSDCSRCDLDDMRFDFGGFLCGLCGSRAATG
jgi:hypothetical protein